MYIEVKAMRKAMKVFTALALVCVMLTGCSLIELIPMPDIPTLELGESYLEGTVEFVNGRTCRVVITKGDSHFDAEGDGWDADVIQVTYTNLEGSKSVKVGDHVAFEYDYIASVSEHLGSPHITVNVLRVG